MKLDLLFEKCSALLFLILLVGMVAFLVFVPMPPTSEKVVLIILGGLMTTATGALPRLFGSDDSKEEELERRIEEISRKYDELCTEYTTIKKQYDRMVLLLVKKYAIKEMEFGQHIDVILESKSGAGSPTGEAVLKNNNNKPIK